MKLLLFFSLFIAAAVSQEQDNWTWVAYTPETAPVLQFRNSSAGRSYTAPDLSYNFANSDLTEASGGAEFGPVLLRIHVRHPGQCVVCDVVGGKLFVHSYRAKRLFKPADKCECNGG